MSVRRRRGADHYGDPLVVVRSAPGEGLDVTIPGREGVRLYITSMVVSVSKPHAPSETPPLLEVSTHDGEPLMCLYVDRTLVSVDMRGLDQPEGRDIRFSTTPAAAGRITALTVVGFYERP